MKDTRYMKRIFLSVLFICTFLSHLTAQTGKESELIKQNYIRSVIGQDESKQAFLQLLSKIPPEKEVSDQNVIELQQLYPIRREEIHRLISTIRETVHGRTSIMPIPNARDGNRNNTQSGY